MTRRHSLVALVAGACLWQCTLSPDPPQEPTAAAKPAQSSAPHIAPPPEQEPWVPPAQHPSRTFESVATEAENPVAADEINLLSKDYLGDPGILYVDAFSLKVREGPGSHYPSTRSLRKGMKVKVVSKKGVWVQINRNEWVSSHYLSKAP